MAALTIKNVPEPLLSRLRARAAADRRSLNREVVHLLDQVLAAPLRPEGDDRFNAVGQADAWDRLAGRWRSKESPRAEARRLYSRRSAGREVRL